MDWVKRSGVLYPSRYTLDNIIEIWVPNNAIMLSDRCCHCFIWWIENAPEISQSCTKPSIHSRASIKRHKNAGRVLYDIPKQYNMPEETEHVLKLIIILSEFSNKIIFIIFRSVSCIKLLNYLCMFFHACFHLCRNANNYAFYQHSGTPLVRNISMVWEIKSDDVFSWLSLLNRECWTKSTILTLLGAEKDRGKLALHYSCLKGQSAAEDTSRPLMRFAAFNSLTAEHCGRNYADDIFKVHYI